MFGTEIHATATSNILKKDWIQEASPGWQAIICAVIASLAAFVILALSGAKAIVILMLTAVGVLAGQFVLFALGVLIPVVCPLMWGAFSGLTLRLLFAQGIYSGWRRR
jgi:CHASE2 domain-containing sensor protein